MENTQPRSHAKDVFLNLASMITLYSAAAALLNLLFTVINKAFPQITPYYYGYYSTSSISFPVATLIIVFPLYILFMWLIERDLAGSLEARGSGIRKWLIYITLFISGGLVVGDLVAVVYKFIDGQELTLGFLLKVLSILVVAGVVFWYYITDIRNRLTPSLRKVSAIVATIFVIAAIVVGFMVIGSPRDQRLVKYDEQKGIDLQAINQNIISYYDMKGILPVSLNELSNSGNYIMVPVDPQTNEQYEYRIIDANNKAYELCANFNTDTMQTVKGMPVTRPDGGYLNTWNHPAGQYCFSQTIPLSSYSKQVI